MSIKGTIRLKDLHFYAYHGYHTEENQVGGRYLMNIEVTHKFGRNSDIDIEDTVDYNELYLIAQAQMQQPRKLLEEVVIAVGNEIKETFSSIGSVKVCLKKLDLPLGKNAGTAEVEMEF